MMEFDEEARTALVDQCLAATTPAEVAAARKGLEAWIAKHPWDIVIMEVDEQMTHVLASQREDALA